MAKSAAEGQNRQSLRVHVLKTVSGPLALTSRPIPPLAGPVDGLPMNLTPASFNISQ